MGVFPPGWFLRGLLLKKQSKESTTQKYLLEFHLQHISYTNGLHMLHVLPQ